MRAISDQVAAVMLSPAFAARSSARLAFSFHSSASLSSVTARSAIGNALANVGFSVRTVGIGTISDAHPKILEKMEQGMEPNLHLAMSYRLRAAAARQEARSANTPELKSALLALADSWEKLADQEMQNEVLDKS
jgi:hypothetical protein